MKYHMIENHPADSRVRFDDSGACQTLSARMGTGGGNVPLVMFEKDEKEERTVLNSSGGGIAETLDASYYKGVGARSGVEREFVLIMNKAPKPVCVMATSHWNAPFTDGSISPTLCARAGTGGNQLPLVVLKE